MDRATFFTIFQEEDRTVMVDELPLPKQKRLGRRMNDRQSSALVSGTVNDKTGKPVAKGTAVLWKDGRGAQYPFNDGRIVSSDGLDLAPGAWRRQGQRNAERLAGSDQPSGERDRMMGAPVPAAARYWMMAERPSR